VGSGERFMPTNQPEANREISHRRSHRERRGYLTAISANKLAKILTWLLIANVSESIVSSTPRPQMQKLMMFQHRRNTGHR
jgi:hypothetical protein